MAGRSQVGATSLLRDQIGVTTRLKKQRGAGTGLLKRNWYRTPIGAYLGAVVLPGRVAVRREDHDVVAGGAQALDQALEPVLHAAHVAEGARLLHKRVPALNLLHGGYAC